MAERLVAGPRRIPGRLERAGEFIAHGGLRQEAEMPLSDAEVAAIEEEGFVLGSVQAYIDRLDRRANKQSQRDAAMLRGAINDLLSRIEDQDAQEDDLAQ